MAKFATYYFKYNHEFAPYEWENRQKHLAALFAEDSNIVFGEGEPTAEQQAQGIPYRRVFGLSGNLVGISINLCKSIQKELFINDTP